MTNLIIYTGLFGCFWVGAYVIAKILSYVIVFLLGTFIFPLQLAEKKPKKYAFSVCVFFVSTGLGLYAITHPDVVPMLVEKVCTNTLLTYLVLGVAIVFYLVVIMSVMKIARGIMMRDDCL